MSDQSCLFLITLKISFNAKLQLKARLFSEIRQKNCFIYSDLVWLELVGPIGFLFRGTWIGWCFRLVYSLIEVF